MPSAEKPFAKNKEAALRTRQSGSLFRGGKTRDQESSASF